MARDGIARMDDVMLAASAAFVTVVSRGRVVVDGTRPYTDDTGLRSAA
jgi:hypothetical protein